MGEYALAIDLGASGGRHILGYMEHGRIELTEVYRFQNETVMQDCLQCWDMEALFGHVIEGMRACAAKGVRPATVGIDTWGVDYTLIDPNGWPLGHPSPTATGAPAICARCWRPPSAHQRCTRASASRASYTTPSTS